jgi:hypothetical protein
MTKKKYPARTVDPGPPQLTQEQAQMLCDAHEVHSFLRNEEEVDLMEDNNPGLLGAYETLRAIADGDDA